LSSAGETPVSFARRPPLFWSRILLVLAIAGAVMVDAIILPQPWRGIERQLLLALRWPALAVLVLLLLAGLVLLVITSRSIPELPVVAAEEPRLDRPRLTTGRSEVRVVTLDGLEPGSGATTLAFNLAVAIAADGEKPADAEADRAVRPACLLAESPLTTALGLDPRPLEERLAERPWDVRSDVVRLGVRHASGCVLFCLSGDRQPGDGVRRLIEQLDHHFDAVLIDGAVTEPDRNLALDRSHLLLLVALPTRRSVEAAGRWIERVWGTRNETTTVMVVNRVPAWPPPPRELVLALHHLVLLPDEPRVPAFDRRGLPWSLDERLSVTLQLTRLTRLLFPTLTVGGKRHAA
jgi:hypothetical protein